ncbi:hypothetical protein BDW02DRAFT_647882 [Decorospora gaudefroyi]|uniref:Uncharacterized protein n=1 Tax=Decorospora gaudefroyi TaxID=184978 RepID=A0A6A5KCY6_9PLEO|nr:hypothetical protein BDW02DRAFT_647882 [Decorospora gaudefroyi]
MVPARPNLPRGVTIKHLQRTATDRTRTRSTRTTTQTITCTLFVQDLPRSTAHFAATSTFDWPTATPPPIFGRYFPIPQIHGVIAGLRRALRLNPHSLSVTQDQELILPRTIEAVDPTHMSEIASTTAPTPRRSAYPRVSPPVFLYPEAIVPRSAYEAQSLQQQQQQQHAEPMAQNGSPSMIGRIDYKLAYLPAGYKLFFLGTLAVLILLFIWTVLVWMINFPPTTWRCFQGYSEKTTKKERRPMDKPSKYAARKMDADTDPEPEDICSQTDNSNTSATTSALPPDPFSYLHTNNTNTNCLKNISHIETRHRSKHHHHHHHHRHRRQHTTQTDPPTHHHHRRTSSSPAPLRSSHTPTPTPITPLSSPPNPFLTPPPNHPPKQPPKPLTSPEWKSAHKAFFHTSPPTTPSASASYASVDMHALEAGTSSSSPSSSGQGESGGGGGGASLIWKGVGWLDQGLGLVDGVVDGVVARVGRWTDGGGGGLVLPVAR